MKRRSLQRFFTLGACFMLAFAPIFAQGNLQKAKEQFTAKEYPAALPLAQAAVKENPRDLASLLLLGDIYDALDQQDSSLAYYQKAQDVDYWKPEVMRKVTLALSAVGKHTEALKKAEELTKTHPKDAESFLALSQVYVAGNEAPSFPKDALTKADAAVIKAQSINKELPATYVARGDIYFAQRVFELAKDNYEEALKRDPNLLESRSKLAEAYFRMANNPGTSKEDNIRLVNESLKQWDIITKADTNNAKAFFNKSKIQFLAKKYAEAIPTLQRYLKLKPDAPQSRWYLAQSAFILLETEKKEYDTALVDYLEMSKKAIDTVADRADLMIAKTLLYKRLFCKSSEKFAEIKANKGLKAEDIELYARAAINCGDTTTAVREYKDFFVKNPKSCKLMMSIGTALYTWRQYDDAIEIFRKRLDPANCPADSLNARAYYYIGAAFFSKNKLDSALPALQESIKLDPKALYVRSQLASTFMEMKKTKEAKEEFLRILEAGKADPVKSKRDVTNAISTLCRIANGSKSWAELKKYAQEWTTLDPDNAFGWFYSAIAAQNLQDTPNACKYYQETIKRMKAAPAPDTKMINSLETQLEALGCAGTGTAPADAKGAKKGKK
ncbi:MAG: tetratricopeptide repeat protein [Ignavibacteria bacterium]|nr:tetratricopeptide repeat protein [Ignavibacteria bacterium]